ncbi:hypothetical protein DACRYDRAFT_119653 [Dacryopinax primogenitus]|uniref:F-box domain-containing protein n=1 Tax=Dacryopinax primogenitus (strain DJM 731) TaxID=1858805 RepID=M5FQX6_DACPD|nr:uncharacterized protein DACRYDRAFT_119653 [Dacryopinax primogenitus]EJT97189.1 hypothetical protein DACRYDRAFT_119653 [Dacryopinax primogenitus]
MLENLDVRYHPGDLRPTREEWESLLYGTPALRKLTVVNSGPQLESGFPYGKLEDVGERAVLLPALRMLRIGCVAPLSLLYLLSSIQAPRLAELCIHRLRGEGHEASFDLLNHDRYPELVSLRILDVLCDKQVVVDAFRRLHGISTLHLRSGDHYLEALTEHLSVYNLGDSSILPRLRTLRTHGYTCKELAHFCSERDRLGSLRHTFQIVSDHQKIAGDPACDMFHDNLGKIIRLQEKTSFESLDEIHDAGTGETCPCCGQLLCGATAKRFSRLSIVSPRLSLSIPSKRITPHAPHNGVDGRAALV